VTKRSIIQRGIEWRSENEGLPQAAPGSVSMPAGGWIPAWAEERTRAVLLENEKGQKLP
jgi:hypothetical protein